MTAAIGVLCARVRVEEKQVLAALAEAGVSAFPVPPAASPLPIGPVAVPPPSPSGAGGMTVPRVMLDRCPDRVVAAAILPVFRAAGTTVVDAGMAAAGDRLAVAAALAAAGLPQPATLLVCSDDAAFAALDEVGYPATLLPLRPGAATVTLIDRDTAEAVIEHRTVLGSAHETVALVQAGTPARHERVTVIAVGGRAIAVETAGEHDFAAALDLAVAAAIALGAAVAGIELVITPTGPIIWDVQPVPEFRTATALDRVTVGAALAELLARRLDALADYAHTGNGHGNGNGRSRLDLRHGFEVTTTRLGGVSDGVARPA